VEAQFHEFNFLCCWLIGILLLIQEIPTPILGHGWKFYSSTPSHFTRPAELPIPVCLLMFPTSRLSRLFTWMLIDKILGLLDIGQKNGRETQQQEETGKCQVSSSTRSLGSIHVASVSTRLAISFSFRIIYTCCIWRDVVWATVLTQWKREMICPGQHRLEVFYSNFLHSSPIYKTKDTTIYFQYNSYQRTSYNTTLQNYLSAFTKSCHHSHKGKTNDKVWCKIDIRAPTLKDTQ